MQTEIKNITNITGRMVPAVTPPVDLREVEALCKELESECKGLERACAN
jgi:hypothetical protein